MASNGWRRLVEDLSIPAVLLAYVVVIWLAWHFSVPSPPAHRCTLTNCPLVVDDSRD